MSKAKHCRPTVQPHERAENLRDKWQWLADFFPEIPFRSQAVADIIYLADLASRRAIEAEAEVIRLKAIDMFNKQKISKATAGLNGQATEMLNKQKISKAAGWPTWQATESPFKPEGECLTHGLVKPLTPAARPEQTISEFLEKHPEYRSAPVEVKREAGELVGKIGDPPVKGHAGYLALLGELKRLHEKKATDYGTSVDPFANIRQSEELGLEPWQGAWLRARDKVFRIDQYCRAGSLANESVEDSFLDLASYCLIALALRREQADAAKGAA